MKHLLALLAVAIGCDDALAQPAPPNMRPGWAVQHERIANGPEGALVVRVGDIDNLGFGWPDGYDPFSGRSGDTHPWPFEPAAGDAPGTDRIMVGSGVRYPLDPDVPDGDGYHDATARPANAPQPIAIPMGDVPAFRRALVQMFVDDFQAPRWGAGFQVSINGTRIPAMEAALNALDQTGPIGKLLTMAVPAEFHALLRAGSVTLLVDDPSTGARDGYAIDFLRVLLDPRFPNPAALEVTVVDREDRRRIAGARVAVLDLAQQADRQGMARLRGLPGGLVVVAAGAQGYEDGTGVAELIVGETGTLEVELTRRPAPRPAGALRAELQREGRVVLRGIRFDTDSAVPRPDSLPDLEALLALIRETPGNAAWLIEGHTDSTGSTPHNRRLSDARAKAVAAWLVERGIPPARLRAEGFGPDRPVAENTSVAGRALNRRVEAAPQQ
jgi:outer membrane protein OmpA-like peptidoglycan-associated protein